MQPKVSVLITTFNKAASIEECIESVLKQTYSDYELIIIDDGSTDNTEQLLKKITDSRINIFTQENKGIAKARNQALKMSKGEYIAFLDSDDLWEVDKLKLQVDVLNTNPNIGVVNSKALVIDKNGQSQGIVVGANLNGNIKENLIKGEAIASLSIPLIRKECFDKVGLFNEELTHCEDLDFWLRIHSYYKFKTINKTLTLYRRSDNNTTKKYSDVYASGKRVLENALKSNLITPENKDQFISSHALVTAILSHLDGNYKVSNNYIKLSLSLGNLTRARSYSLYALNSIGILLRPIKLDSVALNLAHKIRSQLKKKRK